MILAGIAIAGFSLILAAFIVMAAANHPTGGSALAAGAGISFCAAGIALGLILAAVGGVIHLLN